MAWDFYVGNKMFDVVQKFLDELEEETAASLCEILDDALYDAYDLGVRDGQGLSQCAADDARSLRDD